MKQINYTQCVMEKPTSTGGKYIRTSWIPSKFAKKNNFVDLRDNGKWDAGWKVILMGRKISSEEVKQRRDDYKTQRIGSDV